MSLRDTDIREQISKIHDGIEAFSTRHTQQLDELKTEHAQTRDRLEALEARLDPKRPRCTPDTKAASPTDTWVDRKTGDVVPVLEHKHKLSDLQPNTTGVSVGRWLRAVLTGKHSHDHDELREETKALATSPDASGGYTVPAPLAAEFIDKLRARLVLSRAGVRTAPMTSKTLALAKIVGDPAVSWHAENAGVNDSEPSFALVELSARTVVGLVKLSLELSQDSINVEEAIVQSLTGSMAVAIDAAGLGNTVSNGPSGILSYQGRGIVPTVGALSSYDPFLDGLAVLLNANVPEEDIGPIILGTQAYIDLAKLKTGISGDLTPLLKPAILATKPFLPTTAVQSGFDLSPAAGESVAYMAKWSDLLMGIRKDITVRVLNEAFLGSNLQIAVLCYARVDFQPAREQSFVTLEGITH